MGGYVFDTEPLIAFFYNEPGHQAVADLLGDVEAGTVDAALTEVNASELLYKIARIEGDDGTPTPASLRAADRDIRTLTRGGVTVERANWQIAGEVKADGNISLGDAYAVALAHERDATLLVGGDGDFDLLPVTVDVERFRTHGV